MDDASLFKEIKNLKLEAIVVVAFGQILKKDILNEPKFGCFNVHGSVLPRWRGSAPIQRSILAGDRETGVTIIKMDEKSKGVLHMGSHRGSEAAVYEWFGNK